MVILKFSYLFHRDYFCVLQGQVVSQVWLYTDMEFEWRSSAEAWRDKSHNLPSSPIVAALIMGEKSAGEDPPQGWTSRSNFSGQETMNLKFINFPAIIKQDHYKNYSLYAQGINCDPLLIDNLRGLPASSSCSASSPGSSNTGSS